MRVQASNVAVSLDAFLPDREDLLRSEVARAVGTKPADVRDLRLLKRSIDARKKKDVHGVISAMLDLPACKSVDRLRPARGVNVKPYEPTERWSVPFVGGAFAASGEECPIVVGAGPAGLFCALALARAGVPVTLLERGAPVEERQRTVEAFFCGDAGAPLDPESNVQFGEGGAGTFSDGKLNTGIKSPHIRHVLETFVEHGAPESILVDAKPHIGTDRLPQVVASMRRELLDRGCEVRFHTRFDGMEVEGGCVKTAFATDTRTQERIAIPASRVVVACGHSARDTYEMLAAAGVTMKRKRFAVGVRIEHPQDYLNELQHGDAAGHPALGAADYKIAVHVPDAEVPDGAASHAEGDERTRGVYTFCMCPGGEVVAAASEEGGVCTNGMSRYARGGRNANSALLVEVAPDDLPGTDCFEGVRLQRAMEQAAYRAGRERSGSPYAAPAQTVGDFLAGTSGTPSTWVQPTYPRGVAWCDLHDCLPPFVARALEKGLPALDRKLRGFAHPQAVMTGVEARSSSPVCIVRDDAFRALSAEAEGRRIEGLYPAGEGAGYAGGIMSAAVDGLRIAERIIGELAAANGSEKSRDSEDVAALDRDRALARLRAGDPVLFPTDTVFGLGAAVLYAESPVQLNRAKHRAGEQPVAWLVADAADLDRYGADVPTYARALARAFWPGALTLIVSASDAVPAAFRTSDATVALRMPDHAGALSLIREVESPIATTSANMAGERPPLATIEVDERLRGRYCLYDAPGEASGRASTIVDCTGETPRIVREGGISARAIEAISSTR